MMGSKVEWDECHKCPLAPCSLLLATVPRHRSLLPSWPVVLLFILPLQWGSAILVDWRFG